MRAHACTVVEVQRRPYGLARLVIIVRCVCGWRLEVDNHHTAAVMTRHHTTGHAA